MQFFPTFDKDKLKLRLSIAAVIFAVVMVATRALFLQSEPYEFATNFTATDKRVLELIGQVDVVTLPIFQPFRFSFGDTNGSASMTLRARTKVNEFDIELNLIKKNGQWTVTNAQIRSKDGASKILVNESCTEFCK